MIQLVAISDDGASVVSQDTLGGTRLWPRLDGAHEPLVVHIAPASELALGRDGDGFVIAALDEVGGLELVRVGEHGEVASHASVGPEPPIESIAIGVQGVLAVRADQTIAIFDPGGQLVAEIPAPPGTRLHSVVTRGLHTLALIDEGGVVHARWLAGTGWGRDVPALAVEPSTHAALSPNAAWLLADHDNGTVLLELGTGRVVETFAATPLGFVDDNTFAIRVKDKLWWHVARTAVTDVREEAEPTTDAIAVGNGRVVSGRVTSLMLHTPRRVEYLGYRAPQPTGLHVVGDRLLMSTGDQRPLILDGALATDEALQLPVDLRTLTDALPIDDRYVLATHTLGSGGWWTMSVLDLDQDKTLTPVTAALTHGDIRYEPTTQLLEITDKAASFLARWNGKAFYPWYRIAGGPLDLVPLDPAQADGLVAIGTRRVYDQLEVDEFVPASLEIGEPAGTHRSDLVDGYAAAIDRAGRVYVMRKDGDLVVYRHGLELYRLAKLGIVTVTPHPSGAYIAVYGDQRISLYEASGALRWTIAAPLATRVLWVADQLVVQYEAGIGKIDAATGALNERACGWSFGLSALPGNDTAAGESICDAL